MKSVKVSCFIAGLAIWTALTSSTALSQNLQNSKSFIVFDGTLYSDKPDLSAYGLQPIAIGYSAKFGSEWYKQADRLPNIDAVKAVARDAKQGGQMIVLDIEHWPLKGSPELIRNSLKKYLAVLEWVRNAAPGLVVGYYGAPPIRDYWRAIKDPSSYEHRTWMEENDQIRSLASAVDVYVPSLYTFYADQEGWRKYALAQIQEARRYGNGKPVYVLLWPQYHDSNRFIGGHYLSEDYWKLELETAKQHADGIVIWGGWDLKSNRPAKWDENAAWWTVTKEFMKRSQAPAPLNQPN
ncbi:MAG: hypothetical protein H8K06_02430 [Nitrospira sp.]|nr:hypothetical protein [Nitrospira sp.]